MGGWQSQSQF